MRTVIQDTYRLAMAASLDAGNRSARKAGRTKWNEKDIEAAEAAFHLVRGTVPYKREKAA